MTKQFKRIAVALIFLLGGFVVFQPLVINSASAARQSTRYAQDEKKEITVFITRTGHKYHREECRYLRQSCIAIDLNQAKMNCEPCKVCRPDLGEGNEL